MNLRKLLTLARATAAFAAILFIACPPDAQNAPAPESTKPPFTLTISTEQPAIKSGSTVALSITVKNISDHEIIITNQYIDPFLEVSDHPKVIFEDGTDASLTALGRSTVANQDTVFMPLKPEDNCLGIVC